MLSKFFFVSTVLSLIFTTHSYNGHLCLDHQKSLLLQLKNELIFDPFFSTKLVQWNQTDECCKWYGVECDGAGYIVSLQLDYESVSGGIGDSSSLFKLKYLEKLNLANNDFNSNLIPKGIHKLNYLTHLNLSNAGFGGQVPTEVLSLTRLVSLDISQNLASLKYPNLKMLVQNLTWLRELNLDVVNITSTYERTKWSHIISSYLPNIRSLSLVDCFLYGPLAKSFSHLHSLSILRLDGNNFSTTQFPHSFANLSSLTTLSLANCALKGSFPNKIFQIPTLQYLDLSGNELLGGSLPPFTQNGSLKSIRLSLTNFSGSIPSSISSLKTLSEIDLSFSKFTGSIPSTSFANLTQLTLIDLSSNFFTGSLSSVPFEGLSSLVYLDLDSNSFSANIPHSLFALPSLEELHLHNNKFNGLIEEFSIVNVSNIVRLDLRSNQLEGPIPDSLCQLQSLESLFLSENLFSGTFQLHKIQSLPNLTTLSLSGNNLSLDFSHHHLSRYGLPRLQYLELPSCNIYDFPHFIKHSDFITELDLSNNRISGEIPSWIWRPQLQTLDLRSNQLMGELNNLPIPPDSDLQQLLLANNNFTGSIPTSLCSAPNLALLVLSVNKLSGTIPSCLFENTKSLAVLDLGGNNISGQIPDNFPLNSFLQYVDLHDNALEGKIPKSLQSCKMLEFVNVGNNIINDTFPCMLQSSLRVLVLNSNHFHGEVTCHNSWPRLQILDLSSNHFSGNLKSINFSSWRTMVQLENDTQLRPNLLELYSNYLVDGFRFTMKGLNVKLVKIFQYFTAIDFSCNDFHGEIPNAIGVLSSLRLLNFSHNALSGSIPKSLGQLRMLDSLDLSQNQLTGVIPMELTEISFLSFLNLSDNKLTGEIPNDRHLQTFSADSFKGNPELCGFNLNISCSNHTDDESDKSPQKQEKEEEKKREIEWEYVSAALGYVVGLGSIVWLLVFCRSFRKKYFDKIDDVVQDMFDARDMRRRRRATARRRAVRNQAVRRH